MERALEHSSASPLNTTIRTTTLDLTPSPPGPAQSFQLPYVVDSPAVFAGEYRFGLKLRDFHLDRNDSGGALALYGPNPLGLGEAIHALSVLSLRITYRLGSFEDVAKAIIPSWI